MSSSVFGGLCMALGSLSANSQGCVPIFLKFWHKVSGIGPCCPWVVLGLSAEMEAFGRVLTD